MDYGFVLPGGTAAQQLPLAELAEASGWDGIFVWETGWGVDAWTLLGAMAARTTQIRLGTMLTPLPWRRPWKVAGSVATVDQLSGGRVILAVGLGAVDTGLGDFGEATGVNARASILDDSIDLMRALWAGQVTYSGPHFKYSLPADGGPGAAAKPVQERVPIWCVGAWPRPKSMQRILRCDGLIPQVSLGWQATPPEITEMLDWLRSRGGAGPGFDFITEGQTEPGPESVARVEALAQAGASWWLETRWELGGRSENDLQKVRERIAAGPPRR